MGRISRVWAIGAAVLLAACSDQAARDVTAPGTSGGPSLLPVINSVCTSASLSDIQAKIHELYVKNSWPDENSILGKLNTVTNYLAAGDLASAQAYMVGTLLPFLTNKYSHLSAAQQLLVHDLYLSLAAELTCYVDIAGEVFDLNPGDPDKAFEITGVGGVWFPADVVPVGTLVVINELRAYPKPLLSPLDQFSGSLDITLIPKYTFTDPLKLPVIVLCPAGLNGTLGELYVGHQATTGFELLQPAGIPDELTATCDGVTQNDGPTGWLATWVTRAANLLLPEAVQASMMGTLGIGGKGGSFSSFGTTSTTLTALGGKGSSFSPRAMPSGGNGPAASAPSNIETAASGPVETTKDASEYDITVTVQTQGKDVDLVNPIQGVEVTFTIGTQSTEATNSNAKFCSAGDPTNQSLYTTSVVVNTGADGKAEVPCIYFGTVAGFANIHATIDPTTAIDPYTGLEFTGNEFLTLVDNNGLNWLVQSTAGTPTQLVVITPAPPTGYTVAAGGKLTPSPVVELQDVNGNNVYVDGTNVTVGISTGGTLIGTTTETTVDGDATFDDLTVGGLIGGYTLTFTSETFTTTVDVAINAAGAENKLAITTEPGQTTAQAGMALDAQPVVQVRDAYDNPVAGARTITVEIASSPTGQPTGYPTLTNDSKATGGGSSATFSGLAINGKADALTPYTLTFKSTGLTSVTSANITLAAGAATKLAIPTQPGPSGLAGQAMVAQPVVQVQDAYDNPVSGGRTIAATIASRPSGQPSGYPTLTSGSASTGTGSDATFSGLAINGKAGTYTLTFSATDLTSKTSGDIALAAGTATKLAIPTQPGPSGQAGQALVAQPVVQVQDAYDNPVSGSRTITAAIATSPSGQLTGFPTVSPNTASTGIGSSATFSGLAIRGKTGTYTLTFSASGLPAVTSKTSGDITLTAGAAERILTTFGSPPSDTALTFAYPGILTAGTNASPPPRVIVYDAYKNPVSGATVTWTPNNSTRSPATTATNADGLSSLTSWTLGTGESQLLGTVSGVTDPATFLASTPLGASVYMCELGTADGNFLTYDNSRNKVDLAPIKVADKKTNVIDLYFYMSVTGQASSFAYYNVSVNVYRTANSATAPPTTGAVGSGTGQVGVPGNNGKPQLQHIKLSSPVSAGTTNNQSLWFVVQLTTPISGRTFQVWYSTIKSTSLSSDCKASYIGTGSTAKQGAAISLKN